MCRLQISSLPVCAAVCPCRAVPCRAIPFLWERAWDFLSSISQDLGWNDVSFHGSSQIPTPNIDGLANGGVILDNYYVNPVCSPTRASLMTGRSMLHTGIQTPYGAGDDASGLNLTYTLLPQQLRIAHNYTSYMIGKVRALTQRSSANIRAQA